MLFNNYEMCGGKGLFCPKCGNKIEKSYTFCKSCGLKLSLIEGESPEAKVRNTIVRRLNGIRDRKIKAVIKEVYKEKYSKYDDWPPFELQDSEGLIREEKALKVLKGYEYETRSWKIYVFNDSSIVTFLIRYKGKMRNLTFNVQSRVTVYLVKNEKEWKIVHEHWSRFPNSLDKPKIDSKPIIL